MKTKTINRLLYLLHRRHINQHKFAVALGVTDTTVTRYLQGKRSPKIETAVKMAQVLGVKLEYLYYYEKEAANEGLL